MLIDGEKFACEACVRGHRVSNCQHSDRPLQHINKKGRPVSQCQHCRSMRKSRSHHIKCDCGEKTHKCIHLQTTLDGHKESCCCNHGGRCTCSHKSEHSQLDTVPETDSENEDESSMTTPSKSPKGSSKPRKRANTRNSDVLLSFDENGHHKPTYKHKKASQKNGPYQLDRVNSMHSAGSLGNRSVDNLLHGSNGGESRDNNLAGNGGTLQGRRKSKSEAASPQMDASSLSQLNGRLPPLDLSGIEYPPYVPNSADFFGNISDHEQPMFSAGLSAASVDWSHYEGLEFASRAAEFAPSSYSQPQSFGGFDFSGSEQMPTLTTNTSTPGEGSDVEDFLPNGFDEWDLNAALRNGATAAAVAAAAAAAFGQGNSQPGLALSGVDLANLDYDDLKFVKRENNELLRDPSSIAGDDTILANGGVAGLAGFSSIEDDPAFWMENYPNLANAAVEGLPEPPDPTIAAMWDVQ